MRTNSIIAVLLLGVLSVGSMTVSADTSGRYSTDRDLSVNSGRQDVMKNKKNGSTEEQTKSVHPSSNRMIRFAKPALKTEDHDKIKGAIDRVPQGQRLDYLLRVIGKIAKLETNISNSNMLPERKTRFLGMLEQIRILVQARIDALTGSGSVIDITPPSVSTLAISSINTTSATLTTMLNEGGIGYYVILESGSTAPTAVQVKLGQDASGSLATIRGTSITMSGTNLFPITGLSPGTEYVVYFTARDTSGNLSQTVVSIPFTTSTIADITPPALSALSIGNVTQTGATFSYTSDELGTGYYVVLASGSTAPSPLQVKMGQNALSGSVIASGSQATTVGTNSISLNGLAMGNSYIVYLVAQDTLGNLSTSVMGISFTTSIADITPPIVTSLSATGFTSSGATFSVNLSESGTGYYVLLASGSIAPSAAQVKLGQDASNTPVALSGSFAITTGNNSFQVSPLATATAYTLFFTAADITGNLQPTVGSATFVTP